MCQIQQKRQQKGFSTSGRSLKRMCVTLYVQTFDCLLIWMAHQGLNVSAPSHLVLQPKHIFIATFLLYSAQTLSGRFCGDDYLRSLWSDIISANYNVIVVLFCFCTSMRLFIPYVWLILYTHFASSMLHLVFSAIQSSLFLI